MGETAKKDIMVQLLREKILQLEGFKQHVEEGEKVDFGLSAMRSSFPCGVFPTGVVHEFISPTASCAVASNGFILGILCSLLKRETFCLWVSTRRSLFPSGLNRFEVEPHRIIFVDVATDRDALWVMEQALKCNAFAAVVGELSEVSFSESQRLQLSVEKSRVTGFLHRRRPRRINTLACVSRWKISPAPSLVCEGMPGIGHPVWDVQLQKIKNGRSGRWNFGWRKGKFITLSAAMTNQEESAIRQIEHYG